MTILEQARELGIALAGSPEYERMINAQMAFQSDPVMDALINEYNAKKNAMLSMIGGGDYDSDLVREMSSDMERLRGQLNEAPLFVTMQEAQKSFSALVEAVSHEIDACIGLDTSSRGECSGDCAGCSGCGPN